MRRKLVFFILHIFKIHLFTFRKPDKKHIHELILNYFLNSQGYDEKSVADSLEVEKLLYKEQEKCIVNTANSGKKMSELGFMSADEVIAFATKNQLVFVNHIGFDAVSDEQIEILYRGLPPSPHIFLNAHLVK